MPTLEKLLERRKEVSSQVSAQARALSLGLLAVSWAFLTAHDEPLKGLVSRMPTYMVVAVGGFAALALVSDLLQYVWYTRVADEAVKKAEKTQDGTAQYYGTWYYKAARAMYFVKYWLLVIGSAVLAITVFYGLR